MGEGKSIERILFSDRINPQGSVILEQQPDAR